VGLTRRAFVRGAAAAGAVVALDPLRALAQGGSGIASAWEAYAQSVLSGPKHVSAVGYAIVQPGQQPIVKSLGTLSANSNVAAGPTTIYEIGSCTKVFTAILLARTMASDSSITLGTTIGAYLPKPVTKAGGIADLTFGQLATYSNGLTSHAPGDNSPHYKLSQLAQWLNGPNALLSPFTPGTDYYYSNIAWGLLGRALGIIHDTNWTKAVVSEVTSPLGMPDTVRSGTQSKARTATGYQKSGAVAPPRLGAPFLGGGGELVSTPADMATFMAQVIDPGSAPAALQGPLAAVQVPQQTFTQGLIKGQKPPPKTLPTPIGTGLGWFLGTTGSGVPGVTKNGGTTGFGSFVGCLQQTADPQSGIGIFAVANDQAVNMNRPGRTTLGLGGADADQP
jgi:serine-type D-Ala-D-Ala carboxypeptidase/endopeptidase